MKNTICFIAFFFTLNALKAQDQLFKKDNTKVLVKVTEIGTEEIKYKLHNNLNGPVYVISKSEVSLLIYENGQHEVFAATSEKLSAPRNIARRAPYSMSKADSSLYFKYKNNISLNFLNFVNMEVGLIYQHDFLKNNCSVIIPLAIGILDPAITESVYFRNNGFNYNYNYISSFSNVDLKRKLFEAGFGLHYYPSLRFPVNYYIGPAIRYMQYDAKQTYTYYVPVPVGTSPGSYQTISKNSILSRYCVSITNGFIFRTKSRIALNMFASIGFKNDQISNLIIDPNTNTEVKAFAEPIGIYFWGGFAVGYSF